MREITFERGARRYRHPGSVRWRRLLLPALLLAVAGLSSVAAADSGPLRQSKSKAEKRLETATLVLRESLASPDNHISTDLLREANCIGIFPSVLKGAFFFGGRYGKGYVSCRLEGGGWSGPAGFRIEGGNFGIQFGGNSTDLVVLFMTPKSVDKLLRTNFTFGLDGTAAAGPVGRTASANTDTLFGAEIVGYSRSRGVFAGIAVDGATMRPAHKANRKLYGFGPAIRAILRGEVDAPASAGPLLDLLGEYPLQKAPQPKKDAD